MPFGFIILTRLLFVTCMIFIIGYVFGNFSKNATLTVLTKIASILAIILFITANIYSVRTNGWNCNKFHKQANTGVTNSIQR